MSLWWVSTSRSTPPPFTKILIVSLKDISTFIVLRLTLCMLVVHHQVVAIVGVYLRWRSNTLGTIICRYL